MKLKSAFDDNLTNYKREIPQLFLTNAFCVLSNAIETKVGISAKVWRDFETGKSKGFGFVEVKDDWDAERAIKKLDGKYWHGMNLKVCKARNQE